MGRLDAPALDRHIPASGRRVVRYTSPLYLAVEGDLTCELTSTITDDMGKSFETSGEVVVDHREHY